MTLPNGSPTWAEEVATAFESGAHGQFLLYGNVHDRMPLPGGGLGNLTGFIEATLLAPFQVLFRYDLGNGLRVERGGELVAHWPGAEALHTLSRQPLPAVEFVSHYIKYLANLRALGQGGEPPQVAFLMLAADQVLPSSPNWGHDMGSLASLVREWSSEAPFTEMPFASLLIADNLHDVHPLVAMSPRVSRVRLPLPNAETLTQALSELATSHPSAFPSESNPKALGEALAGVGVAALESLVRRRAYHQQAIANSDLVTIKKGLVETESEGLVEFIESTKDLSHYHGQEALKRWLRQDASLWRSGDLAALPMGYLVCGPVGTGKTFLVECLAGEAGVPVVRLKNFRDRWVGSSEGNLEKIFRLVHGLGRAIVFIDEADQTLGKRDAGSGDSGLSGRLYAMIAEEMGNSKNRGRILWLLASSRPDLIEVDLKRPGRVDVKVPLMPTTNTDESAALLGALCKRRGIILSAEAWKSLKSKMPVLLTPGAAEALAVKAYRLMRTRSLTFIAAVTEALEGYQPPVPRDVLEFQMRIAIREATDLNFVPEPLRHLANLPENRR